MREVASRRRHRRGVRVLPQGLRGAGGGYPRGAGDARAARVPVRGTEFADAGPDARAGVPSPPLRRRRVRRGHRDGRGLVRADVEGAGERDR